MSNIPSSVVRELFLLVVATLAFSLVPVADVYRAVGTEWRGVPPVYTDEEYYYARIKEVKDGYPFIGNPYLYEHRGDMAPTFFVTDWLASLPLLAGLSLSAALVVNFSLWSVLFSLSAFLLLREFRLGTRFAALGALLLYLQSYLWVLRPVSLQQVFPFFFLLLFAALRWYRSPGDRRAQLLLAGAAGATFYLYLYLFQIAVVAFGLLLIVLCVRKDWERLRHLVFPAVLGSLLALPAIVYTAFQLKHPFYWEMAERITLVYTHLPTAEVVYSGGWVVLIIALLALVHRNIPESVRPTFLMLSLFGAALVVAQASNLITGQEAETAVHVKRFVIPWLGLCLAALVSWLGFVSLRGTFRVIFYGAMAILVAVNIHFIAIPNFSANAAQDARARDIQALAGPLEYLERSETGPVVVWAVRPRSDDAYYIPALTKHYVLYAHPSMWHLVGNDEIMERYLLANYVQGVTKERLIDDMSAYGGPALAWHRANTVNREVRLCKLLRLDAFGRPCGETVTSETLVGAAYFDALLARNESHIRPHVRELLEKYHVAYILSSSPLPPALTSKVSVEQVYEDSDYFVYRVMVP